ncbi:MAG: SHOCT domain-containing protein [Chloroflexota bacterium]|nr:SHOCT domain-containing protein [Chloroflexota bacterium]
MFGIGWQELLILLVVGGVVYMTFFSAPVRRRLTGLGGREEAVVTPLVPPRGPDNAEAILEARFARGDIDAAEFESKRAILRNERADGDAAVL